ncbi:MAG: hypothetical protein ASARMPRED_004854 [Alectoria sarmentosa]|nr:MAG: hypothetical protein ASARMPRED_004854 [Alectoria sarmentosa]
MIYPLPKVLIASLFLALSAIAASPLDLPSSFQLNSLSSGAALRLTNTTLNGTKRLNAVPPDPYVCEAPILDGETRIITFHSYGPPAPLQDAARCISESRTEGLKHLYYRNLPIGRPLLYLCGDGLWLGLRPDARLEWGDWIVVIPSCFHEFIARFDTVEFEFGIQVRGASREGTGFVGTLETTWEDWREVGPGEEP